VTQQSRIATIKLMGCVSVSLVLLLLWYFGRGSGFGGLAMAAFILVGAPATLLVAIDTGRVLRRREHLSGWSLSASRLPQIVLAVFSCGVAIAGIVLAFAGTFTSPLWQLVCLATSVLAFLYGLFNLRPARA
jgi:hypothetical protein